MAVLSQQPNDLVAPAGLGPDGRTAPLRELGLEPQTSTSATGPTIEQLLASAAPGQVQLVHCTSVRDDLRRIERVGQQQIGEGSVVACIWSELPSVAGVIDEILDRLAQAAGALWPNWYGCSNIQQEGDFFTTGKGAGRVLSHWYRAAATRCRDSQLPRLVDFAPAVQLQQLALAISPDRLVLTLAVEADTCPPDRLIGLARGAEWLALNTSSPVLVLVPDALAESVALDPISFAAIRLGASETSTALPAEEKRHLLIWPIRGRPHPNSVGEQLLAAAIRADDDLRDLFLFNEYVDSIQGHRFLADLLWREGKVVVEVDGYVWHSDPTSFSRDRQRDYELLISGYFTLRLPHHEVVEDVQGAITKIRQLVMFRRQQSLPFGAN